MPERISYATSPAGRGDNSIGNHPACGAKTRRGDPCRALPVHGANRCRMHGGKGSGAPKGNRNAVKHGLFTARERALHHELRRIENAMREDLRAFK